MKNSGGEGGNSSLCSVFRCHALDVGNRGAVKAERAVRIPFQDFHDADTANVIGVLSRKFFSVVETRSQHDINSNRAIGCRPGKKDSSRPVLILQPLPVLREMELFAFCLIRPRVGKHELPHVFLLFNLLHPTTMLGF